MPNGWQSSSEGPQSYSTTETALSPPPPPSRNKLEPWIFPHQGRTQRNPPTSPPSITSLFFQAVTTCKAFPQAEHMDLINCRSLTTLSCPNSLNCLYLNPLLHLLLLPPQPRPHSCFPTCIVLTCDRDRTSEHKPTSLGQSTIYKRTAHLNRSTFTFWYVSESLFMRL